MYEFCPFRESYPITDVKFHPREWEFTHLEHSRASNSSNALGNDVQQTSNDGHFSGSQQTNGDSWIQMSSAHMTQSLKLEKNKKHAH